MLSPVRTFCWTRVSALALVAMVQFAQSTVALGSPDYPDAALHPCEYQKLQVGPELPVRLVQDRKAGFREIEQKIHLFENQPVDRGLGFTTHAVWVSLVLENPTGEPCKRWLVVSPGLQEHIRLHVRSPSGVVMVIDGGSAASRSEKTIQTARYTIFPLEVEAGTVQRAFLEFRGSALMQFQIAFWEPVSFIEQENRLNATRYLLIGSSLIMLFSTLLLSRLRRKRGLLFGGCAWTCALLYMLIRDGFFYGQYPPFLADPRQQLMQFMSALFLASYCLFSAVVLPEESWSRPLRRVLRWLAIPATMLAVVYLFISLPAIAVLSSGATLIGITAILIIAALRGGEVGWTYLSGWLLLNGATVLRIMNGLGWVGISQLFAELAGPLSFGASALTTSFALYRAYQNSQQETRSAELALQRQLESERDRLIVSVDAATTDLKEALRKVESASKEKSRFLAMVAHELNSPLHTIQGNVRLAMKSSRSGANERLIRVSRATSALVELVDQTLRFSRGETLAVELDPCPFSLKVFIDDLLDSMLTKHGAAATRVSCRLAGPVPEMIETDEETLRKVLANILDNAVKYAPEGSIELLIEVPDCSLTVVDESSEYAATTPLHLRFSVQDQGPGIAAEFHEKIFEPFTRLTPNQQQRGVGLGLPICRQLLNAMSSRLELVSAPGQGSCFHFELVVARVRGARLLDLLPPRHVGGVAVRVSIDEGLLGVARELLGLGQLVTLENWAQALKAAHPEHREFLNRVIAGCANIDLEGLRRLLQGPDPSVERC